MTKQSAPSNNNLLPSAKARRRLRFFSKYFNHLGRSKLSPSSSPSPTFPSSTTSFIPTGFRYTINFPDARALASSSAVGKNLLSPSSSSPSTPASILLLLALSASANPVEG
eukprot:evm.model.NODE_41677_length_7292_cov_12.940346.2